MIGDAIDTFRITTPAANQEFVRISWAETTICHMVSYTKIWYFNHVFSGNAILLPDVYEVKTVNNKFGQVTAKKRPFWPFTLDKRLFDDVKLQLLDRMKKHEPVSHTHSSFQSKCVHRYHILMQYLIHWVLDVILLPPLVNFKSCNKWKWDLRQRLI